MKLSWENLFRKNAGQSALSLLLKNTRLFQDLEFNEIKLIEAIMNPRQFHAGEYVFHQGDGGVGMYIITSGSVNVFLEEGLETQEVRQTLISTLTVGDFFGESALVIEGGKRSASVIAKEDSELLGFFFPELKEVIRKYPEVGTKILFRLGEVLGTRLRETNRKLISLISENETLKLQTADKETREGYSHKQFST